ncbi:MAG TPA: TRAP transporter substrate-binding protein [Desulfosporosinus sp.]|nr:TRAP transporter substrate-binding protein [Desulfosporosinus sp.]
MKKIALIFMALLLSLSLTGCGDKAVTTSGGDQKIVIKYTHGSPETDPHQWTALKFKELVGKYSNGKVEVTIFPSGQLGSEQRGFQDVQNNVVQATSLAINNATVYSPSMGIFDLPYLFKSREEAYKVIDGLWTDSGDKMIKESGNRPIIWFEEGFRVLSNSKKEVKQMSDMKGLKIRVPQNALMLGAFKSWGASPTPISWDETFNALQQGVVDGQENPYPIINSNKMYEVQKYITDIHYKLWVGAVVVNEKWLQGLSADVREAILKAGKEASIAERDYIQGVEKEAKDNLIAKGMVFSGTPVDEDVWMKNAMGIWPDYYDKIGGTELLEKAMKILGREMPKK